MEIQNEVKLASDLPHALGLPPTLLPPRDSTHSQRQRPYRISVGSAVEQSVSTSSPFYSPTSPTFLLESGLAPRPPSYPYKPEASGTGGRRTVSWGRGDNKLQDRPTSWRDSITSSVPSATSRGQARSFSARAKRFSVTFEDEIGGTGSNTRTRGMQDAGTPGAVSTTGPEHRNLSQWSSIRESKEAPPLNGKSAVRPERVSDVEHQQPTASTQDQRLSRSVSAPRSLPHRREWAPDRSPLQKLELTLQDITKEEKRAQLEEAELLAREARAGRASRRSGRMGDDVALAQPNGVHRGKLDHLAEAGLVRSLSSKQKDRILRSATIASRKPIDTAEVKDYNEGGGFEYQEQQYRELRPPDGPFSSDATRRTTSRKVAPQHGTPTFSNDGDQSDSGSRDSTGLGRGNAGSALPDPNSQGLKKVFPVKQSFQEYQNGNPRTGTKSEPSAQPTTRGLSTGNAGSLGNATARSIQNGYSRRDPVPLDSPQYRKAVNLKTPDYGDQSRAGAYEAGPKTTSLSSSRPAGTGSGTGFVQLTATDLNIEPETKAGRGSHEKAWWEGGSTTKASKGSKSRRRDRVSDDIWQNIADNQDNGMHIPNQSSHFDVPIEHLSEISRRDYMVFPVRKYTRHRADTKTRWRVQRRNKSGFPDRRYSKIGLDLASSVHVVAARPYSYTCPHLSKHDIFHPFHVCPPKSDKELTRSMRSIRVRSVAEPSSFTPPLYLKCGPLLRYLGIRQESGLSTQPQTTNSAAAMREIWRGSIMIVTTDSDSSYEPAPMLRLFSQPMTLLPPPPAMLDASDVQLPPEYVDPIAGFPKLSRTGETVYVKPVDHLEEEKDLSKIETDEGLFEGTRNPAGTIAGGSNGTPRLQNPPQKHGQVEALDGEKLGMFKEVKGYRLHMENGITFWRFLVEIELGSQQTRIAYRINQGPAVGFWVPAKGKTMNMMFHSCNGFSLSVDPDQFSGPDPMWRDVLNAHQSRPFHVMIGGGDQIYNDVVMRQASHFQTWLTIRNPMHKRLAEFSLEMQEELETFYLERYSMWFSQGLFGMAAAQIPMINIWDDHDIIDGFGSYPHHFMSSRVFSGLGNVAFKYYMLFQHHSLSTETSNDEPSWLLGPSPGPYIDELSRSVFMFLGAKVAFLGLDCRTERTRDEILSEETYSRVFERCRKEIIKGETRHLIVLLGVPIAYPRLVWLENVLTSRLLDPVKALGRAGMLGGFANKFDGGVEILDDLDDHWTAKNHKAERNWFVQELQQLAAEKSVRVTILGGDVHLAAVGQFYSNPKLEIAKDRDHRYMPNVISSAIVNTPPPEMLSDVLNKRNKVHHLDINTDEDMIPIFTHDVDGKPRNNKRLLARRNWCSLREYNPGTTPPPTPPTPSQVTPDQQSRPAQGMRRSMSLSGKDILPGKLLRRLSRKGDSEAEPINNPATINGNVIPRPSDSADNYFPVQSTPPLSNVSRDMQQQLPQPRPNPFHRQTTDFLESRKGNTPHEQGVVDLTDGLDIVLNVEVNQKDPAGITVPYRLLVPALWYESAMEQSRRKKSWMSWGRRMSLLKPTPTTATDDQYYDVSGHAEGGSHVDDRFYGDERPLEDEWQEEPPMPTQKRTTAETGNRSYQKRKQAAMRPASYSSGEDQPMF